MPMYQIKQFSGLSDYEDRGTAGSFKFASNLDVRKDVDSLSCGQALTEEGSPNFFTGIIRAFVNCADGNTYGFDHLGTIYRRTSGGLWAVVYHDDGGIKGAAEWYSSTGKTYLYWAGDIKLNRKEIPGNPNWTDVNADAGWPKTNLTSAAYHTMAEAGGDLIIANAGTLALVGFDDSYTNEALDLIPGNIAKTILERSGRSIVGTYRAADPEGGINGAIDAEYPLAQIGSDGQVFFANLVDTMPIKRFPGGGKVNPGGVTNQINQANFFEWEQTALSWINKQSMGNMALFGVYGAQAGKGGIYSLGRFNKNKPFAMNLEHALDVDEIGAIIVKNGTLLISYRKGAAYGVTSVDPNNKAIGVYEGLDFRLPVGKISQVTKVDMVHLQMAPLPANTSIEFWYRMNKIGEFVKARTANGKDSFTATGEREAVFRIAAESEIYEPRVVLKPFGNSSPEVYTIVTYFT